MLVPHGVQACSKFRVIGYYFRRLGHNFSPLELLNAPFYYCDSRKSSPQLEAEKLRKVGTRLIVQNHNMASAGHKDDTASKTFVGFIKSRNRPLVGTVLTLPSVTIAQLAGQSDGEFVMIDMEHAPLTIEVFTQMVHAYVAASRHSTPRFPLVRIPSHGVEWVKWAMDSGASGIVVPMVNNAAEMRAIIDRAIYPPAGRRSFGPLYAPFAHPDGPGMGMGGYFERAQRGEIALLPVIESKEGLKNAEEILSLDGVSGVFIGPADLRLSLGLPPAVDGSEPEFLEALQRIYTYQVLSS